MRLVPWRRGIAPVESEIEAGATSAKESTAGMTLVEERKYLVYLATLTGKYQVFE